MHPKRELGEAEAEAAQCPTTSAGHPGAPDQGSSIDARTLRPTAYRWR